jgi:hypothetical protein
MISVPAVPTLTTSTSPKGKDAIKQAIKYLQTDFPSEAEINKIQAEIAKMASEEEEAIKKEGAESSAQ